ncbi:hypothetical protein A2U01_0105079, partial [Trifolium medium]|nr:hypothetical protein [Trifolium medium]
VDEDERGFQKPHNGCSIANKLRLPGHRGHAQDYGLLRISHCRWELFQKPPSAKAVRENKFCLGIGEVDH